MDQEYENMCEEVDASVFSGELVINKENREAFKVYLARWQKNVDRWDAIDLEDSNVEKG